MDVSLESKSLPSVGNSRKSYLQVTSQKLTRDKQVHLHGRRSRALPSVGSSELKEASGEHRGTVQNGCETLRVSAVKGSGHVCPGNLKRPPLPSDCEIFGCKISAHGIPDCVRLSGSTSSGFPKRTRAPYPDSLKLEHTALPAMQTMFSPSCPDACPDIFAMDSKELSSISYCFWDVEIVHFSTANRSRELKIGSPLSIDERDNLIHLLGSYLDDDKVRVCVDFRDLNKASPKDDFPLPTLIYYNVRHRADYLVALERFFQRIKKFKLRLNPKKYIFDVSSGKLLGYMVSE
ncbi:hypothetical protein AAG906_026094 [Vitis piasezkii]